MARTVSCRAAFHACRLLRARRRIETARRLPNMPRCKIGRCRRLFCNCTPPLSVQIEKANRAKGACHAWLGLNISRDRAHRSCPRFRRNRRRCGGNRENYLLHLPHPTIGVSYHALREGHSALACQGCCCWVFRPGPRNYSTAGRLPTEYLGVPVRCGAADCRPLKWDKHVLTGVRQEAARIISLPAPTVPWSYRTGNQARSSERPWSSP
jgi:hypothetical protein